LLHCYEGGPGDWEKVRMDGRGGGICPKFPMLDPPMDWVAPKGKPVQRCFSNENNT